MEEMDAYAVEEDLDEEMNDPGARAVPEAEIRNATGAELAKWKLAAEKELHESFYRMGAVTETTDQELARVGGHAGVLPMKTVWGDQGGRAPQVQRSCLWELCYA